MNHRVKGLSHPCAAPGCDKVVPGNVLMCYPHWRLVPGPLRRRVTVAWLHFERDPYDAEARSAYNTARREAIDALATEHDA
jgi:hypothetical protein